MLRGGVNWSEIEGSDSGRGNTWKEKKNVNSKKAEHVGR